MSTGGHMTEDDGGFVEARVNQFTINIFQSHPPNQSCKHEIHYPIGRIHRVGDPDRPNHCARTI